MSAPTLPSLEEVQAFFKRFTENQKKLYETFKRSVENKMREQLVSDDPKKQSKLEKIKDKYHKKLKKSCENLKKQCEVGEKLSQEAKKIEKEASPQTIKLLKNFQNSMNDLHQDWEKLKMEISALENEIITFLSPSVKAQ